MKNSFLQIVYNWRTRTHSTIKKPKAPTLSAVLIGDKNGAKRADQKADEPDVQEGAPEPEKSGIERRRRRLGRQHRPGVAPFAESLAVGVPRRE